MLICNSLAEFSRLKDEIPDMTKKAGVSTPEKTTTSAERTSTEDKNKVVLT